VCFALLFFGHGKLRGIGKVFGKRGAFLNGHVLQFKRQAAKLAEKRQVGNKYIKAAKAMGKCKQPAKRGVAVAQSCMRCEKMNLQQRRKHTHTHTYTQERNTKTHPKLGKVCKLFKRELHALSLLKS